MNQILSFFTNKDKNKLIGLLILSITISIIEVVGISAIMPFIQIVTDNEIIHTNKYFSYIYNNFLFTSNVNFIIAFGITLAIFYVLRGTVNLVYVFLLAKFTQNQYQIISVKLFEQYMNSSYGMFLNRNSSVITKNIISEAQNLTQIIHSTLFVASELFIFIFICLIMIYIDWKIALITAAILGLNAFLMLKLVSRKIKVVGGIRAQELSNVYEKINSNLGNFKVIKLHSHIEKHIKSFRDSVKKFTNTNVINSTLTNIPRIFFETVGFSAVIFITTFLVWQYDGNIASIIPILSIFILSLYRLLPSFNRILTGYNEILFFHKSIQIIRNELNSKVEVLGEGKITFNKNIVIKNIDFGYLKNKQILKNLSLKIKKGSSIAFIGESGSGKSTLVDIIMGLSNPNNGSIFSDGVQIKETNLKSWRRKIGYIPQSVYLFDGSIGENITFGAIYDRDKVNLILQKVSLNSFLKSKDGQDTHVGENGAKLSGGQKQRVAIARALYSNPEILILDEATSALDIATEKKIMEEIYNITSDKTLIVIAHRISTIDKCDYVYKLENGNITNV